MVSVVSPDYVLTSSSVMWSLDEMPSSLRKHLISIAFILLSRTGVRVHVSQADSNIEMVNMRISMMFKPSAMFLSFQTVFNFVSAAVVCTILDNNSDFESSSATILLQGS
ncbi:hypothetical protein PoB_006806300 [Plakobranchus ocellatus]|uniref:Odorant receptor n=1 Tax=Plakobranchus ocellatus TaxID=259542 RepID=A0AAV4DBY4_9GAST|nr:hypothetical protein PoB_006806300 [Plakobranchus ocellatus]